MSSTTTSATAACTNLYNTPVHDAYCAMPYSSNHTAIMEACCGNADVVSYYNNCGLYCLAIGQSVEDLVTCLYDKGAAYNDVFCNGTSNATAIGKNSATFPASAEATIINTATTTASGKNLNSGTSTGTGIASTSSDNAAPGIVPGSSRSTFGLFIGALLVWTTVFATLQI